MTLDHLRLADQLLGAVLDAGAAIMHHRRGGFSVELKADASPVTIADHEAEEILLEALGRCAPGVPVIAEEASSRGQSPALADAFFLVDPLDGTREFVAGGTDFTVNIGLVGGGVPQFGLIYAPALEQLYVTLGEAAAAELRIAPDARPAGLADARPSPIRTRAPDARRLVAVASRSHRTPENERFVADPRIASCRSIGSSLKFCLVARGEADIYPRFGATSEWDTAAGHAIVLAAGGAVTALDGSALEYGKAGDAYVNPPFVVWGRQSLAASFRL
ncbi:MAG: 3'(2'),5'-bisphosphate nucleotidase CysQ [Hyphomicrobiaceae bacterium]|nr:3'(2'),5'-bisphosphate nucleotidase CysQ [Hyphomicrobiaceae bacterium]